MNNLIFEKSITAIKKAPLPIPDPTHVTKAFDNLVNAWKDCTIVSEQEKTKRAGIKAFRDVNVKAIEENSALLKLYLEYSFKERAFTIQGMFERLDQSLANGDTQMASSAIAAIVSITKESPLAYENRPEFCNVQLMYKNHYTNNFDWSEFVIANQKACEKLLENLE